MPNKQSNSSGTFLSKTNNGQKNLKKILPPRQVDKQKISNPWAILVGSHM